MPGRPPRRGWSILVVDDNELLRASLTEMLVEGGWSVEEACDGQAALERLRVRLPDVVLLDQRMPRMTGEQLVVALREAEIRVPIVLMSAMADDLAARLALRFFLEKPFGMTQLFDMLTAAIHAGA